MLAFHDFSILVSAILVTVVLSLLIELRYSKTVNFIAITGQLAVSMLVFLLLVSRNVERSGRIARPSTSCGSGVSAPGSTQRQSVFLYHLFRQTGRAD